MARITVEDCLTKETNRFALVQLAAKRTKQLLNGGRVLITDARGNKAVVTSLREIAAGKVRFMTEEEMRIAREREEAEREEQARQQAQAPSPVTSIGDDLFKAPAPTPLAAEPAIADDDDDDDDDAEVEEEGEGKKAPAPERNGDSE